MRLMKSRPNAPDFNAANDIAVQALAFLAGDMERLGRFLALTGLDPTTIRQAARQQGFLVGVLDHVLGDEALLVAFAAGHDLAPQDIAEARAVLAGPQVH